MIITQTPLRISFAGGGTDLPAYYERREGYVVSAAIDKAVFVIVTARYDSKIYINYSRKEIVDRVDDVEHELVREAMKVAGVTQGVEITLLSDIPSEGAGLGSSSSFAVGLLNALHVHRGEQVGPLRLAEEACDIEIGRCGKPIGKQDQYIAAFGGVAAFRFKRDGAVDVERLAMTPPQAHALFGCLYLFYSDQTRKAADILGEQKRGTPDHLEQLDGIKGLAVDARAALASGEFDRMGAILDRNWSLKKGLASRISNPRIEEMYASAQRGGATGGKVCGAGGGGFLLVYGPAGSRDGLLRSMREYRQMPVALEPDGSKVIFNYRRSAWK